ncbi:hypothetical protein ACSU64_28235 [Bacillaceae bacterium C204]
MGKLFSIGEVLIDFIPSEADVIKDVLIKLLNMKNSHAPRKRPFFLKHYAQQKNHFL